MFKKAYILLLVLLLNSCSSLVFDQSKDDIMDKDDGKTSGISLDVYQNNKNYESNRILSSDFPVTYKAKALKKY